MDYESAIENMDRLMQWSRQNDAEKLRNEAATRLHLIDTLLIDCLGWPREQIDPERSKSGERSDYELGLPAKKLLIEAKREGIYFELPAGFSKGIYRIKTLYELSEAVRDAIEQAMHYCQTRGIPIGVVANGHQLVIFISNRLDGIPPEAGFALVFESLDSMRARFKDLWDAISPAGAESKRIFSILSDNLPTLPPEKMSSRILDYPGFRNRNPVAAELRILGGLFLEDIARLPQFEEEFVRDTYCESGAISQYALVSRQILHSRYTSYLGKETKVTIKPVRSKKGIQPELREDLLAAGISQRPIILVGDVGVGKSMFVKHLILVDAKDILVHSVVLYLDFGKKPALPMDLTTYVIEELERQLLVDYKIDIQEKGFVRGVYHLELQRFAKGIFGDLHDTNLDAFRQKEIEHLSKLLANPEEHMKACITHIANGQKRLVVLFLDNVDQRPLEFQEQVFLIAQSLSQTWPLTCFVALRPDTFAMSRTSGSLAAYQPRVFSIDPPRVDRVLQQRLNYALSKLKETGSLPNFPKGVSVDSQRLERYIEMLLKAFTSSREIISFIDNMCNGNLRKALDFVDDFVGSAHVDSEKIFNIIDNVGSYTLPLHEFLRAAIFRDNVYFDPNVSSVLNTYDVTTSDKREHFLLLMMLSFIDRMGSNPGTEGFVPTEEIYRFLQGLGFIDRQIISCIQRSVTKNLMSPPGMSRNDNADRFRILTAGAYTSKVLSSMFTYIDAIIVDTPILNQSFKERLQPTMLIEERLQRVLVFAEYLDSCWETSLSGAYDWPMGASILRNEVNSIQYKIRTRPPSISH